MSLKFRDGAHFAALDGGPMTLALATALDHPIPGDDAHERRAVTYDNKGNGLVFYKPLAR